MFACSFVCILVLHFVVQSTAICVQEYGTDSTCTDSLILLVPRSRLEETNGYGLLVKDFPSVSSNEGLPISHFTAKIGNATKQYYDLTDKVPIPSDIGSGLLTVSLNYVSNTDTLIQCTNEPPYSHLVSVQSQYLITLQIFDNPVLHYRENPDILECQFNHPISSALIEFKLNDNVLGYCGSYMVRPLEDTSKEISIFYDATSDVCALQINAAIDANIGTYSCSVMIPYPTGNAFLKLNSSSFTPPLSPSPNAGSSKSKSTTIGIVLGVIATIVVIVIIISVIILVLLFKKKIVPCNSTASSEENTPISDSQRNDIN